MQPITLTFLVTILTYCMVLVLAYNPQDIETLEDGRYDRDLLASDPEPSTDLRKYLLKKLRFRDILKAKMLSPEEILSVENVDNTEARHKAAKRHKMNDLVSRFRALLSDMQERQIKESMELPSLRFGRSGTSFRFQRK